MNNNSNQSAAVPLPSRGGVRGGVSNYNPDVLSCLANLSNDEVFTPPQLANQMLDLLPQELFRNPDTKFLDPCTKSGVFLREIAKRLIDGLANEIPDLQERIDHIMHHQLYGIAITRLTSMMSRRSLYCSKDASGKYSLSHFDSPDGHIRFSEIQHTWIQGKCRYCGASQEVYDRGDDFESHAYEFIHTENPKELYNNMTFDVIIGNPPYQLSDGGNGASAIPIYNKFVTQAIKLSPRFLTMIIPARWYAGGRGLDDFRELMLNDNRIKVIVDYFDSQECFPGIDLSGGVCYFLWDKEHQECSCEVKTNMHGVQNTMNRPLLEKGNDSFIRFNEAIVVLRKVRACKERSFKEIVSRQKPFGFRTYVRGSRIKDQEHQILLYGNRNVVKDDEYVAVSDITQNLEWVYKYKVYISAAYGERGDFPYLMIGKPFLGEPFTCCSETFQVIGPFEKKQEAVNAISYIKTKFFRFMVLLVKNTQHAPAKVYSFVPLQDFSKPWTDDELYAKYGLTEEEIAFIESMIRPMD
jgi:site-specific DNA-methyltransferase (adenine-specific)